MNRPSPAIVVSTAKRCSTPPARRAIVLTGTRSRIDRDRSARLALRTQLAALEAYYGVSTAELIAHRASDTLPESIPRSEAARWAELLATLERLVLRATDRHSRS